MTDVDVAVALAKDALPVMARMPGHERISRILAAADVLRRDREAFVEVLMAEAGKLRRDAEGEADATIERMRLVSREARAMVGSYIPDGWTSDTVGRFAVVMRVPVGVVAVIGPFNYPLFIPAAKAVPALVAGNAVVMKPASSTSLAMVMFAEVLSEAGFPEGAFTVVRGKGSQVGKRLVTHPDVAMVSFTGGTEVGDTIARTVGIKRLQLELGGKGTAIVLPDADLALAARKVVEGSLKNSGQRCDAVSLVLYCGTEYDDFVRRVVEEAGAWGKVGPLIDDEAAERVSSLIEDAVARGATQHLGGRDGRLILPTVLTDVTENARIVSEETFGPVGSAPRVIQVRA